MKKNHKIDLTRKILLAGIACVIMACKIIIFPDPTATVEPTKPAEPTAMPSTPVLGHTDAYVREQVIASITSKNTQALEGYMADSVLVRLEATECCGPLSRTDAMSQLSYIDPATDWNFDPTHQVLVDLAAAIPDRYGSGWIVGVAGNEYVAAFRLNAENKVDAYNLAVSYKILIP